jgi:hypothetical protein
MHATENSSRKYRSLFWVTLKLYRKTHGTPDRTIFDAGQN